MSVVHALLYPLALVVGVGLGWLLCMVLMRRRERPQPASGHAEEGLAAAVVQRADTGFLVLGPDGRTRLSNPRADTLGIARQGAPEATVIEMAAHADESGVPVEMEMPGRAAGVKAVEVVASALGGGYVLVTATDASAVLRSQEIRRDFVANVSHELKTPVAAIGLLAEAIRDGADEPEIVRTFAVRLQREATRLGTMVSELLALSTVQGSGPLAEQEPVGIDDVVSSALDRASVAARTAGITLISDKPSDLVVMGDRGLLTTAVANLVENAIHYSPSGSTVSVARQQRGDTVEIAVTDRGIGIAHEHQQRVFERFFRVDPARSRATGGTGLGLSIVKHVAASHGGSVSLWSRVGVGSTFTVTLPLASEDDDDDVLDEDLDGEGFDDDAAEPPRTTVKGVGAADTRPDQEPSAVRR